jgi:starvation-inducible DNA-binding protein
MAARAKAIVTRTVPGLDNETRERMVELCNKNLANLTDLAICYKQAHWNVTGDDFKQLHEMFDEFTDETREFADTVAERALALGGAAHGSLATAAAESHLPAFPDEERHQIRLVEELTSRIDIVTQDLRAAMDESEDEMATQDVFVEVTRGIEKQRWMLQSHLA